MIRVFPHKLYSLHLVVAFVLAFVCLAVRGIEVLTAAKSLEFGTNTRAAASARSDDKGLKPDTTTGIWTMTGSMNQPRADHTATLLPNGKVLAAGGSSSYTGNNFLASAELYDPATSLWSFTGSLNNARRYHTATLLANGKVLVAGGYDGFSRLKSAELYDPATGTWSPAGSLLNEHANHTATLLQDGKVLVAGGFGSNLIQNSVELYNPALNTWTSVASLNTGRRDHTATLLSDGRVLVTGGYPNANGVLASTEVYNPIANSWSNAASLITGRGNHRATMLGNGKVLVAGGTRGGSFGDLASAELFDSTANTWTAAAPMSSNRITPTATVLQNGRVLMLGGGFDGGSRTGEMYDYTAGSWSDTPDLNFDRRDHTATLLQNGSVLVAGGYDDDLAAYSTSELYHPTGTTNAADPKIVFAKNREGLNHEIYVMDLDGTNQSRLTTSPAYDDQPKWSPDSSKIVFISDRDSNFEIYKMNADGSGQTRLTNSPAADGFPAWSPDGTRIAFVRGDLQNPSTFEIYVMNADGSNQVRLTSDSAIDGVPSWSPDGTKIVFMSGGSSVFDPNSFEIYVINADGNNRTRLTNNAIVDGQPSYSPDGTKILFAAGDALNPNGIEIYVMNADGSNRVQLTSNNVTDGFPAWSFDGSSIVFASGNLADETSVELFMMNANGTNQAKLTTNSDLDWFPDWQRIPTPPSQIQFTSPSYAVNEGSGGAFIVVSRSGNPTGMAAVGYATSDAAGANNCNVVSSAASSRCDYEPTLGTLNFAPGERSKIITVFRVDDSYAETSESFTVSLSNAVGSGVSLGAPATATVTINDNDSATGANPIDQPSFFVFQHYTDFLNREPDAAGADFWTNQITSCGSDAACIEIRRINVSAAFFLSIEFQETGYLVYRMYKVAYPPAIPVPVRYDEFMSDTQQVSNGVVIGQPGADLKLESNKQTFAVEFVLRLRFTQAHPISNTPAQLVDALYANAVVTPSASERTAAINEFSGAPNTVDTAARARVLRRVAENATLKQQELNKAFVLMEYFGYLRRNPNDPPEATLDYSGYNFWLGKLNQFNGNFVNAEMVKAFLVSTEYRQRFGPP